MNQHTRDTISTILPHSWNWGESPEDAFTRDVSMSEDNDSWISDWGESPKYDFPRDACMSEDKESWVSVGLAYGVYSVQLVVRGVYLLNFQYTDVEDILTDVQPLLDFVPTSPILSSISCRLFSSSLRNSGSSLYTILGPKEEDGRKIDWSIQMQNDGKDHSRIIVSSSQGIVCATSEFSHSRVSISAFEDNQQGMRDVLDLIILRTNH